MRTNRLPPFRPTSVNLPRGAQPSWRLTSSIPQLSLEERDRRWQSLRFKMKASGVNCLILLGNDLFNGMGMIDLRYLFQLGTYMGAEAIFPLYGDPVVWTGPEHMGRPFFRGLAEQKWMTDIRHRAGIDGLTDEIKERGFHKGRVAFSVFGNNITGSSLSQKDFHAIQKALPDAEIVDFSGVLSEMRLRKSEEEIAFLRKAGQCARQALDAVVAYARPGLTEAQIYAKLLETQIISGAEPNLHIFMSSGPVEHPEDELWFLLHGAEAPTSPTQRVLQRGDVLITEYHTKFAGYRSHTEYSMYFGKSPPPQLRRIWDVSVECLEASKEALVVGRSMRDAWEMIRKPAHKAGLDFVELGWHGMGLDSPVFPTVVYPEGYGRNVSNGHGIGDFPLEEGMTMGNNIDLHDPTWKPDVGLMLADFMVVRPGRAECLVNTPIEFPCID